jgi:hypothetical protein
VSQYYKTSIKPFLGEYALMTLVVYIYTSSVAIEQAIIEQFGKKNVGKKIASPV